jgi:hypothetical protein
MQWIIPNTQGLKPGQAITHAGQLCEVANCDVEGHVALIPYNYGPDLSDVMRRAEIEDIVREIVGAQPVEARSFPVNLSDKLSDWDTVQPEEPVSVVQEPITETVDPRDDQIALLRARIAELEATLAAPVLELSNEPPAEALLEAYPDEDHAALKARIMAEFASLRNALIGQIPMTHEQLDRLVVLEHPKYQSWLQGVTK